MTTASVWAHEAGYASPLQILKLLGPLNPPTDPLDDRLGLIDQGKALVAALENKTKP